MLPLPQLSFLYLCRSSQTELNINLFPYSGVSVHPDRISEMLLSRNQYIFLDKPSLFSKWYQYQIYVYVLGV